METRWFGAVSVAILVATASCSSRATPEECTFACRTHAKLMQAAMGYRNNDVREEIEREMRRLQDALERELEVHDREVDQRLDLARDDDQRTALIEEYEERVEARRDEYQPRFLALEEAKSLSAGSADDEESLLVCINRCLDEHTGKRTAHCRANAVDLAAFYMCR